MGDRSRYMFSVSLEPTLSTNDESFRAHPRSVGRAPDGGVCIRDVIRSPTAIRLTPCTFSTRYLPVAHGTPSPARPIAALPWILSSSRPIRCYRNVHELGVHRAAVVPNRLYHTQHDSARHDAAGHRFCTHRPAPPRKTPYLLPRSRFTLYRKQPCRLFARRDREDRDRRAPTLYISIVIPDSPPLFLDDHSTPQPCSPAVVLPPSFSATSIRVLRRLAKIGLAHSFPDCAPRRLCYLAALHHPLTGYVSPPSPSPK
ncbi:hypothetical protein DFH07DRAFT_959798 [Mycena maculata]|uniref:Uncharacterized protein n=1 Tax=Mycena maculata TaxID=230809 RepID=A0AAD7J245_9AGAR|nr:hypothetical protein DFH07DRAFT_959798 [Mycena maculata]